ncbi:MAG: LLM class flavin-dependent oxidoreductase [Deltaproteobacteria bacterium]|nr:LLM class flavin-dependent oxidoreductase [Deltaproteobacteria bacterium]
MPRFGISFTPDNLEEFRNLCSTADSIGFERIGIVDSQSIYRELYVACTLAATGTRQAKFGPRVTNALTRHPAVTASAIASLNEIAPGRVFLGIGSGDSAVYNLGLKAAPIKVVREYVHAIKALYRSGEAVYQGREIRFSWTRPNIPIYVSAHGPKTLRFAGEVADGVIIGTGVQEDVVADALKDLSEGANLAGKRLQDTDVWWFLICNFGRNREEAKAEIRMSLAAPANQLARFTTDNKHIPPEYLDAIRKLNQQYDFRAHLKSGTETANTRLVQELGLEDYLADRYAVVGTVEECREKISQLAARGVENIWMSVYFPDKIEFMRQWADQVMDRL